MSKRIKRTAEEREQATIQDYKDAYKAVHGIYPVILVVGMYIRICGQPGVTLRRLKTLTSQLKNRHFALTHTPSEAATKQRPSSRMFRH